MSTIKKRRKIARSPRRVNVPKIGGERTGLKFYDTACAALERAKSVDEVKEIKNQADALKHYARQAKNKEVEADAAEIRMRAIAMIGVMMNKQSQTVGLAKPGEHGGRKRKFDGLRKNPTSMRRSRRQASTKTSLTRPASSARRPAKENWKA
jgi:hypothetical protein